MKRMFVVAASILIGGCAYNDEPTGHADVNRTNAMANADRQELHRALTDNTPKVPLIYSSHQHYLDYWSDIASTPSLLEHVDEHAKDATGAISAGLNLPASIIGGAATRNYTLKRLTYNIIWDDAIDFCPQSPLPTGCIKKGNIKPFAKDYTKRMISSDLVCKNTLFWKYLAYGASIEYRLHDSNGEVFDTYLIDINHCPRE